MHPPSGVIPNTAGPVRVLATLRVLGDPEQRRRLKDSGSTVSAVLLAAALDFSSPLPAFDSRTEVFCGYQVADPHLQVFDKGLSTGPFPRRGPWFAPRRGQIAIDLSVCRLRE